MVSVLLPSWMAVLPASCLKKTQLKCQRTSESITHNSTKSVSNLIWSKQTRRRIKDSRKLRSRVRRALLVRMDFLKLRLLQLQRSNSVNLRRSCKRRRIRRRANCQTRTWSVLHGKTRTFKLLGSTQHLMQLWPKIQETMTLKSCRRKKVLTRERSSAEACILPTRSGVNGYNLIK